MQGVGVSKWASDARQRRSKRYAAIHADLREYAIQKALAAIVPKPVRHKIEAQKYRQQGQA